MTKTKTWTILKGKVVKIHRKSCTHRICPRVSFLTNRNKYQYLNSDIGICMCLLINQDMILDVKMVMWND